MTTGDSDKYKSKLTLFWTRCNDVTAIYEYLHRSV